MLQHGIHFKHRIYVSIDIVRTTCSELHARYASVAGRRRTWPTTAAGDDVAWGADSFSTSEDRRLVLLLESLPCQSAFRIRRRHQWSNASNLLVSPTRSGQVWWIARVLESAVSEAVAIFIVARPTKPVE